MASIASDYSYDEVVKPPPDRRSRSSARSLERLGDSLKGGGGDSTIAVMPLETGTKLGAYEILAPLGAGGMGEVYRARDRKLDREVAVKVLPDELARDEERLVRFEREAKLLASLNHPNIATVHQLEKTADGLFLVMEMVEGETLAERLARSPLALADAFRLFRQVADGLSAAHEKGIVHRDLKPANIMVTPEDTAKILDFGLAKTFGTEPASTDLSQSPTLMRDRTQAGVILGTASYMSPEQTRAKPVDKRADVWAYGCCLYEALTGRKAFAGQDVTDILVSIARDEPDFASLPAETPPSVRRLLRRCLRKETSERLRDLGDARLELDEGQAEPVSTPARQVGSSRVLVAAPLVVVAALTGAAVGWSLRGETRDADVARFRLELPEEGLFGFFGARLAISPDGKTIVYSSDRLYKRAIDATELEPIPGTQMTRGTIFFSPDSEWLAFFADGQLKKVSLRGGQPESLAEAGVGLGGTWGPGGIIVYSPGYGAGLWQVPATGGEPRQLIEMEPEPGSGYALPHFLPDGRHVLFTVQGVLDGSSARIDVLSLETGDTKTLVREGTAAHYLATGHLLFARQGNLMVAALDVDRLELEEEPVPVLSGVNWSPVVNRHTFDISTTGTLVYATGGQISKSFLTFRDRQGGRDLLYEIEGSAFDPRLSPNRTQVAVSRQRGAEFSAWVLDLDRGAFTKSGDGVMIDWAPDGKGLTLFEPRSTATAGVGGGVSSPDRTRAYLVLSPLTGRDIWIAEPEKESRPLIQTPADEKQPVFSRDGSWLAYVSDSSGRDEVYIASYPDLATTLQISTAGGMSPVWARNGRELFYLQGNTEAMAQATNAKTQTLMAVELDLQPSMTASRPTSLFTSEFALGFSESRGFDVTDDPNRFLVIDTESEPLAVQVVLNWPETLKAVLE